MKGTVTISALAVEEFFSFKPWPQGDPAPVSFSKLVLLKHNF
jgi:hypothetical protein